MATNTSATSQNHNGTGSQANFAISFPFLLNSEIEVTVGGVLKTLGTHYNIVGSEVQFTSGNIPASGTANIVFNRDTNISTKRVDFEDGSVLTEADLDNNVNQVLFAQQELSNDYVKRDGSKTITGNLVFEGSVDDTNETTLAITNPTADRTITIPDVTGSVVTTGDTGTVAHTMLANDAVDGDNIADDSINSEHYVDVSIDTQHIANENITTAKLAPDAVTSAKLADNSVNSEHYVDGSIDHEHLANDIIDGDNIQDDVINSEHYVAGSIDHEHLANDIIDGDNIQDDVINSEHYVAGSIDHEHLANDIIDGDNVQDNAINNEHIAANAVRVNEIKDGEITSAKLNPNTVITASEQASATTNDTSFLTSAAADARFFNISTGDTIKDGDTFPDNDTTIATTAAINDRIIDLVDDVGGFTIIASEQAFPNVNPQGVTGQAAVLSIKAATTNLVPSGTTVTVTNGNVADNADITITGVTSTIPSGFGFLVESTSTLHRYSFHRLVPKATEVTTVAGKAVEIGRLGTADAVADMAILGTTDVVADMAILGTNDVVADMNTLATADIVSDMNTLAVADVISDMDTVATNVTNVNNVGGNVTNVNSVSNSAGANQTFIVTVQNVSGNKYFIDGVQTPVLKLARGKTYTFDMSDSSNSGHPLAFRDSSDNSYTTGVTTSGTAGNSGATVVIVVAANAPSSLKYYCTSHGNAMGNTINVIDDNVGIVAGSITNVNNVGGSITNVNNVGNSISNVNTVASNINNVNSFFNTYRIGANNPTDSLDVGDLFFNTTSDSLKIYTGSAWVDGVTATGNFALKTGNTFTGSNIHNDNVKLILGTDSDLEFFHNGSSALLQNSTGNLTIRDTNGNVIIEGKTNQKHIECVADGSTELYEAGNKKLETTTTGVSVTGNIAVSGNVDGRDVAADGVKLDGIETGATADQTASDIKTLLNSSGLVNAQIDASAAIAGTKISPTFGSQNISTTGGLLLGDTTAMNANFGAGVLELASTFGAELVLRRKDTSIGSGNNIARIEIMGNDPDTSAERIGAVLGFTCPSGQSWSSSNHATNFALATCKEGTTTRTTSFAVLSGSGNKSHNVLIGNASGSNMDDYYLGIRGNENTSDGDSTNIVNFGILNQSQNASAQAHIDFRLGQASVSNTAGVRLIAGKMSGWNNTASTRDGYFKLQVANNATLTTRLYINNAGRVGLGNIAPSETLDVTGNIAVSGTVDGVDVAALNTTVANITTGTSSNNGKFLRANNGQAPSYETVNTDLVSDTSPQLGGPLDCQTHNISLSDSSGTASGRITLGEGNDLQIYHSGSHSFIIDNGTGDLKLRGSEAVKIEDTSSGKPMITCTKNFGTEIYHQMNSAVATAEVKFATTSTGVTITGNALPASNNAHDLGSTSKRWANIYTNDLNLSNEGGSNDVDGTWGSYTIQEGEEDLYLINKRNGKKYKFALTEVS